MERNRYFSEFFSSRGFASILAFIFMFGAIVFPMGCIVNNADKKKIAKLENTDEYIKENILVLYGEEKELEYFVHENLSGLQNNHYYSPETKEWYDINPGQNSFFGNSKPDENTIISNSIFPLDFYLTDAEKEKETFTLEELEAIKERITQKDLTLTKN